MDPHNVELYTIAKGILSIAEWSGTTPPVTYIDVGNAPTVEVEPTLERLPHYSSRGGFKDKDRNPITMTEYSITFDLDEIAAANLNKYLLGVLSGNVISGLQGANTEFALKFESDNPIGPNQVWEFWKCTLSPNGAIALIGEEYMTMSFSAEGLSDVANHPTSPYFDVTYVTTTTTTTTV